MSTDVSTPAPRELTDEEIEAEEVNLGGRPGHKPTEEQRNTVKLMSAGGIDRDMICRCIGIKSKQTLMKYYRDELDMAKAQLDAEVVGHLIGKIRGGDTASIIFYLKTRMNWKESQVIDVNLIPAVTFNVNFVKPAGITIDQGAPLGSPERKP